MALIYNDGFIRVVLVELGRVKDLIDDCDERLKKALLLLVRLLDA